MSDILQHGSVSSSGALSRAAQMLATSILDNTDRLDAELLLAKVLNVSRSHLHAYPEQVLTISEITEFFQLIERRKQGEPIAYICGFKEFWSLKLEVTPDTLIPRPETELLVELALAKRVPHDGGCIADLGTGSGAVALAVASERPLWTVYATDNAPRTLAVAERNAKRLELNNVHFCLGHWCSALPRAMFDIIVSNPPYICLHDGHLQSGDLRYEPRAALVAGEDGLQDIRYIAQTSHAYLRTGGWLMLEHGCDQGDAALEILKAAGYGELSCHTDLAGHRRVVVGRNIF